MMRIARLWICLLVQLVPLAVLAQEARIPSASVEVFTPQGTARQVRQVTARFTAPIVTLGDPRLADPFDVQCPATGQGRWADPRNWVFDFDEDLPAGLQCTFTLRAQLKTAAGGALSGKRSFSFSTGGPAIGASYPRDGWEAIDEQQVFLLRLDAPANSQSVEAHAHCVVEGIEERIGVEVLTGEERAAVLKERRSLGYQYFQLLWKNGEVSHTRLRGEELDQAEESIAVVRYPPRRKCVCNGALASRRSTASRRRRISSSRSRSVQPSLRKSNAHERMRERVALRRNRSWSISPRPCPVISRSRSGSRRTTARPSFPAPQNRNRSQRWSVSLSPDRFRKSRPS